MDNAGVALRPAGKKDDRARQGEFKTGLKLAQFLCFLLICQHPLKKRESKEYCLFNAQVFFLLFLFYTDQKKNRLSFVSPA